MASSLHHAGAVSMQLSIPMASYTARMTKMQTSPGELRRWMTQPDKPPTCSLYPKLPWTADLAPTLNDHRIMSNICSDCPVLTECARHGLKKETVGGFYAGVWLPWPTGRRSEADERGRARRALSLTRRRTQIKSSS